MFGGAVESGKAFVKFFLDDKEFKSQLKSISSSLTSVGKAGLMATAPLIAGFGAATAAAVSIGDELGDMAVRTGFSTDALSELKFVAGQTGTSLGTFERGIRSMQKGIVSARGGTGAFSDALKTLKINLQDIAALPPEKQFQVLSVAISNIADPTLRAAVAMQVFGKSGAEMLPMLVAGERGIEALRVKAKELNVVLSDETIAAAQKFDDAMNASQQQIGALGAAIGGALAGPLADFISWTQGVVAVLIEFVNQNQNLVRTVAAVVGVISVASTTFIALGQVVTGVEKTIMAVVAIKKVWLSWTIALKSAIWSLSMASATFGKVITLITRHPILAFFSLLAAGLVALAAYFNWTADSADNMSESIDNALDKMPETDQQQGQLQLEASRIGAQIEASVSQQNAPGAAAAVGATSIATADLSVVEKWTEATAKGIGELVNIARRPGGLLIGAG